MKKLSTLLAGVLFLGLAAISVTAQSLSDGTWHLASIRQGRALTAADDSGIKLNFGRDGKFGGFNGCNAVSGDFRANRKQQKLRIRVKITSLRACTPEKARWESEFAEAAAQIRSYSFGDGRLYLTDAKRRVTYGFTLAEEKATVALGGSWQLATIRMDDQIMSAGDSGATLNFSANGRYSGNTGCNSYGGAYTGGTKGSVTFGAAMMTRRACVAEEKNQLEANFMSLLAEAKYYRVAEGQLYLTNGPGENVLIFTPAPDSGKTTAE